MSVVRPAPKAKKWLRSEEYINREYSWLQFNRRVLHEAERPDVPLLDRLQFLSIFESNLDEFYMVRVSGLIEQEDSGSYELSSDGLTPAEQLGLISKTVRPMRAEASAILATQLMPALEAQGVKILRYEELSERARKEIDEYFRTELFSLLTPLVLHPALTLPFISSRSLNLAVVLRDESGATRIGRVKVPSVVKRLLRISKNGFEFLWLEDLIRVHLNELYAGVEVVSAHMFRVVRDADIEIRELEAGDLLEAIEQTIQKRRFGDPVLLEVSADTPAWLRDQLQNLLELESTNVFVIEGLMGFDGLQELASIDKPKLRSPRFVPYLAESLSTPKSIFETIDEGDVLLHHPFDSFLPVEEFVRSAAVDPNVMGIKMTLYRVGRESPIVESLLAAAEAGKQVAVIVELKARFDESNNLGWARMLERAGVHVSYGFSDFKTHCKLCLIVRRSATGIRSYVHIGTGNYNPSTAQLYTDLGLMTSNPEITQDAAELFNYLTGFSKQRIYRKLLVSPLSLRPGIIEHIHQEIAAHREKGNGRIVFKMNSLVDPETISALYEASAAGVKVDLIIRGICAIRPGHDERSQNIHVRSIVGRFLEHSRLLYFANNGDPRVFIGSSDIMRRNLDRRIEVLVPVESPPLIKYLKDVLIEAYLRDTKKAWIEQSDGTYKMLANGSKSLSAQSYLMRNSALKRLLPGDI